MITVDKELETNTVHSHYGSRHAFDDAMSRTKIAHEQHKAFFEDPQHIARVEQTRDIVKAFFNNPKLYYNERGLNGVKPFSVIKVQRPLFPNQMSQRDKQEKFYGPLKALGVEIIFAKGSDSYLFRIR